MSKQNKPTYAPTAVATSLGWMNPKTGELIVSVRGLDDSINLQGQRPQDYTKVIAEALKVEDKSESKDPPSDETIVTETPSEVNDVKEEKVEEKPVVQKKSEKSTTKKTTKKTTKAEK